MRNASFLWYPSRSENSLIIWSVAQNMGNSFDFVAFSANLIWAFLWEPYGMSEDIVTLGKHCSRLFVSLGPKMSNRVV
jgi:hypothetical protein